MTTATISARILPRTRAVTAALIVGFALLTALMAQVVIPLWFTPVPITGFFSCRGRVRSDQAIYASHASRKSFGAGGKDNRLAGSRRLSPSTASS